MLKCEDICGFLFRKFGKSNTSDVTHPIYFFFNFLKIYLYLYKRKRAIKAVFDLCLRGTPSVSHLRVGKLNEY